LSYPAHLFSVIYSLFHSVITISDITIIEN